jgi:tRNA (mo5U34)-methyltransferase
MVAPAMTVESDGDVKADAARAIGQIPRWYHSMDLAPGVVTPGWFDLRPIVDRLPWPDVRGKRCLDVGTSNGFLAFELERRGADEVVAVEIASHEQWDWEEHVGELGPQYQRHAEGPEPGLGFKLARELLGSSVRLERATVYQLEPSTLGRFDVVVCGSLLLHLRDPLGALAAIRSVCDDVLLSANQVDLLRSVVRRRLPLFRLDGTSGIAQWWLPNAAGHRQLLRAAGFEILRESGLYAIPFGPAHPPRSRGLRGRLTSAARGVLAGGDGVPNHAILARVPQPR